jgi:Fe-S cluster biogenesis protein NfuA/nitrite reductase/ring-hydroxylating ferredoxin subunit
MPARGVGERIEQLLTGFRPGRDKEAAEELVRVLVTMYGEGLSRIVELVGTDKLVSDGLVESLLLLHDLHPDDVDTRIQRALDRVRPYLGSHAGGVEYAGVDSEGVAHLRLQGNCQGCPSSTVTVQMAIETALMDAAPDLTGVEVAGVTQPAPLLQVGFGPPAGWVAPATQAEPTWAAVPDLGPPDGHPLTVSLDGTEVLMCSVRGTLYAYRDSCPCGSSLASAALAGSVLTCPSCGSRFDVRNAGRGVDDPAQHLSPLPLLSDSQGVRVAVPT